MNALYLEFERISFNLISKGFKRFSADGVGHILRYETGFRESSIFKINNNSIAQLSRQFISDHPEHSKFFQTRKSKYDRQLKKSFSYDHHGQGAFI